MGRSQTIFLMIVFIFWPLEQSAFLEKLELQTPMWIRVNCDLDRLTTFSVSTLKWYPREVLTLIHMGVCSSNFSKNALCSRGHKINGMNKKIV